MQNAITQSANGKRIPITAGPVLVAPGLLAQGQKVQDKCPNAPTTATCPECGGTVVLRKRTRMDGKTTWFYRHTSTNPNDDCPRRYRPTR